MPEPRHLSFDQSPRHSLARMLAGRGDELAELSGLLDSLGQATLHVLLGDAGIGKSALLEYAAGSASGMRVLRVVGVESEKDLPYAAVQQVCAPIQDRLERLPKPQQGALRTTFGLAEGPAADLKERPAREVVA